MPDLTCVGCSATGPAAAVERTLAICANCGLTLVVDDAGTRVAVFDDVRTLDESEMKRLKRAHGAILRPTKRQR